MTMPAAIDSSAAVEPAAVDPAAVEPAAVDPAASPGTRPSLRPAEVCATHGSDIEVTIDGRAARARLALAGSYRLRAGDQVLVAESDDDTRYVIGVLRRLREADVVAETADGATVRMRAAEGGGHVLTVEGPDGAVWFEHSPADGRSVVRAPTGTLEIRADSGDLDLVAHKRVRLNGGEGVELRSGRSVTLEVGDEGEAGSHLSLTARGAQLVVEELRARLDRADATVTGDVRLRAALIESVAEVVSTSARLIDDRADRVIERARESYREITELAQTRAGQVRLVAEKTFRVLAERTLLKARRDMILKGETIYLD